MNNSSSFLSKFKKIFPAPKYLDLDPVAIDLSDQTIRFMKLRSDGVSIFPDEYKEIKIDKKVLNMSEIDEDFDVEDEKTKTLIDNLKKLKKEFKFEHAYVVLPESESYIFKMEIPKEAVANTDSVIKFNIEENVPISASDAIFSYSLLHHNRSKFFAIVNVFPRQIIDIYTKIFDLAEISVISFESESVALSRAIIDSGDEDPYLSIRFLEDKVSVSIIERNVVQYDSAINISISDILDDLDGDSATELKNTLNKLLVFWFTNRDYNDEHKKIQVAILSGENSDDNAIHEFLEKYLKIEIRVADPWKNCFSIDDKLPEIKKSEALKYVSTIGILIDKI
ncbi:MAG TPA: hypothetical protein PKA60_02460 [Candidatus Paceibacterota bacterium]|nr:hypothetical protein [Candidatus Paceibacterota bacterium]